jgi:hypothetical protein
MISYFGTELLMSLKFKEYGVKQRDRKEWAIFILLFMHS